MSNTIKYLRLLIFSAALLLAGGILPAAASPDAASDDTKQAAKPEVRKQSAPYLPAPERDAELYGLLSEAKLAAASNDIEGTRYMLKELAGECADQGITSYEPLSAALIKEGQLLIKENNFAGGMLFLDYAVIISPNFPPSYFAKGWGLLARNKLKMLVAFDSFIDGFSRSIKDFWWSYNYLGNKATSLLFTIAALFTLFGLLMSVRYMPLLAHDLAEMSGRLEREKQINFLILPAAVTTILLVFGYWVAVPAVLLALWVYFNKREKALSIIFFLLLVFMPTIMSSYASFVQGGGNTMLRVMDEVNKGRIEPGTEHYLRAVLDAGTGDRNQALMSLAQTYVKQQRYADAVAIYKELVAAVPDSPIYKGNLANVYFLMGEHNKAVDTYISAIQSKPNEPLLHFNLSQIYGEMLMFTERSEEDRIASRLAPDLVSSLRDREGVTPRRMVFDYPMPAKVFWDAALTPTSESRALAASLWSTTIRLMPLKGASFAGVGFIVLVLAINAVRRKGIYSHFCEKCGKVSCKKCQRPIFSRELCAQCHQIFVKLEGVEARDRLRKTLEIREKEKKEGLVYRVSSLLLPGSGHYLIGRPLRGFIFSGAFIFMVKDVFFGRFLESPYSFSLNVIGPDTLVLVFLLLMIYLVAQMDIYRLSRK